MQISSLVKFKLNSISASAVMQAFITTGISAAIIAVLYVLINTIHINQPSLLAICILGSIATTLSLHRFHINIFEQKYTYIGLALALVASTAVSLFQWYQIGNLLIVLLLNYLILTCSRLCNHQIEMAIAATYNYTVTLTQMNDILTAKVNEKVTQLQQMQASEIAHLHKLATLGKLTAGLVHDLNSPLSVIQTNLELISGNDVVNNQRYLARTQQAVTRINSIIEHTYHQLKPTGKSVSFTIQTELQSTLEMLNYSLVSNNIEVQLSCDSALTLSGDTTAFIQIMTNLINNAVDAIKLANKHNRIINLSAIVNNGYLEMHISDTGTGFTTPLHIMTQEFHTSKESNHLGLGLSIVTRLLAEQFKGELLVANPPQTGFKTTFIAKFAL